MQFSTTTCTIFHMSHDFYSNNKKHFAKAKIFGREKNVLFVKLTTNFCLDKDFIPEGEPEGKRVIAKKKNKNLIPFYPK